MSMFTRRAILTVPAAAMIAAGIAMATTPASAKDKVLERVVLVSGGDTSASNGLALLEAFDDIAVGKGPCSMPGPSANTPCLVKLGPGVFDLLDASLLMVDHVDLAGSGERVTVVTGATADLATALLTGADAELRDLTVENTRSANNNNVAVRAIITGGSDMQISNVTAVVSGGGNTRNEAISVGGGLGGAPILRHVTAIAQPEALGDYRAITVSDNSDVELIGVDAQSSGTALALIGEEDDTVTLRGSHLSGDFTSITVFGFGSAPNKIVDIHASQLAGTLSADGRNTVVSLGASQLAGTVMGAGVIACVFVYDAAFAPHTCNAP